MVGLTLGLGKADRHAGKMWTEFQLILVGINFPSKGFSSKLSSRNIVGGWTPPGTVKESCRMPLNV